MAAVTISLLLQWYRIIRNSSTHENRFSITIRMRSLWGNKTCFDFLPYMSPALLSAYSGMKKRAFIQFNNNHYLTSGTACASTVTDPPALPSSTSVRGLESGREGCLGLTGWRTASHSNSIFFASIKNTQTNIKGVVNVDNHFCTLSKCQGVKKLT